MKVVVLGASGKLGQTLVARCLASGHEVTAAVRDPDRLNAVLEPGQVRELRVLKVDAMDSRSLDSALAGQHAAISAAGNVADGAAFVDLFDCIVSSAERTLGERRIWMLAGAAILDIPHTQRIALGLPFVPARYRPHLENWQRLQRSPLNWALACPGSMVASEDFGPDQELRVSVDTLPYPVGSWARVAPPIALSLMMKSRLKLLNVPYRGVAKAIANALEPSDRFSRRRVGFGLSERQLAHARTGTEQ